MGDFTDATLWGQKPQDFLRIQIDGIGFNSFRDNQGRVLQQGIAFQYLKIRRKPPMELSD